MKIGIIGAGNIGGNLTRRFTAVGHDVAVANSRGPETLGELAAETGATAVHAREAAAGAEVVVVTIPLKHVAGLPDDILAGAAPGAVVIDTNNYYPQQRDGLIAAIEDEGLTESQYVSRELGVPVVKAFNGIFAANIVEAARPQGAPDRIALPVAGDDAAAKAKVMGLIEEIGFDAVDAGPLAESWRQQPGSPSYGPKLDAAALREALAAAVPERTADFRAQR
jgi:predicted dinucleotide-binding enzyme